MAEIITQLLRFFSSSSVAGPSSVSTQKIMALIFSAVGLICLIIAVIDLEPKRQDSNNPNSPMVTNKKRGVPLLVVGILCIIIAIIISLYCAITKKC